MRKVVSSYLSSLWRPALRSPDSASSTLFNGIVCAPVCWSTSQRPKHTTVGNRTLSYLDLVRGIIISSEGIHVLLYTILSFPLSSIVVSWALYKKMRNPIPCSSHCLLSQSWLMQDHYGRTHFTSVIRWPQCSMVRDLPLWYLHFYWFTCQTKARKLFCSIRHGERWDALKIPDIVTP